LVEALPPCIAVPITTSSIAAGSIPARCTAAWMAMALMLGALRSLNAPRKALAIGVRAVERITASCMVNSWLIAGVADGNGGETAKRAGPEGRAARPARCAAWQMSLSPAHRTLVTRRLFEK